MINDFYETTIIFLINIEIISNMKDYMKKREILSLLTINFCYTDCTFLSINKIMCREQKSRQYLRFLFMLKNKVFLHILR